MILAKQRDVSARGLERAGSAACLGKSSGKDLQLAAGAALEQLYACVNGPSQAAVYRFLILEQLRYLAHQSLDLTKQWVAPQIHVSSLC